MSGTLDELKAQGVKLDAEDRALQARLDATLASLQQQVSMRLAEIAELRQQRDDLLAALKTIFFLRPAGDCKDPYVIQVEKIAGAAIARATGEQP